MTFKKLFLAFLPLFLLLLVACAAAEDALPLNHYIVTFYSDHTGQETLTYKRLKEGSVIRLVPSRTADGSAVLGWMDAEGQFVDPEGMTVTENMDFYAYTRPTLYSKTHTKYMGTIASVWFRPETALRREEAAQILYSILAWPETEESSLSPAEPEEDSAETEAAPVATPPAVYTTSYQPEFSDLDKASPYYAAIQSLAAYHLMSGYPDGTFRPSDTMTRAEFVAMLAPYGDPAEDGELPFADVPADYWAAQAIATASANGWLAGMNKDYFYPERPITRAEAVTIINRLLGHNPDRQILDLTVPEDLYADTAPEHWAYYDILEATYTSELLSYVRGEVADAEPGFIHIGGKLYYINSEKRLEFFEAGFHTIDDSLRYCSQSGYAIDEFDSGLLELNGSMYYVRSSGSFAVNYHYGYLYFGEDGRYTSGSDYLDELVEDFLSGILHNRNLSRSEKLYAAYERVKGRFSYLNRGDGYRAGTTSWTKNCAITMFEKRSGHCYYWAAAYMYCARRLGYQAYAVAGKSGTYTDRMASWHAWVMIDWSDGNEYIFDPELEWSYEHGFIDGFVQYRDLYMQPFYSTETLYTFADGSHTRKR